jgi:hypothetical protein
MASIELNLNRGNRDWHITLAWHQETAFHIDDVMQGLRPLFPFLPFDVWTQQHLWFGRNKDIPVVSVEGSGKNLDWIRQQVVRFNRGMAIHTPHITLKSHEDLKVGERLTVTGISYRNKVIAANR